VSTTKHRWATCLTKRIQSTALQIVTLRCFVILFSHERKTWPVVFKPRPAEYISLINLMISKYTSYIPNVGTLWPASILLKGKMDPLQKNVEGHWIRPFMLQIPFRIFEWHFVCISHTCQEPRPWSCILISASQLYYKCNKLIPY
jgi:hypothetical protein